MFEGPLDLLLHLIEKAEVDIHQISVSQITDQYVAYVRQMQELQLEVASEFLVMAATLLAIKSQMLLPRPKVETSPSSDGESDEGPDLSEALIQRLIEYKKYKHLAAKLREEEVKRSQIYTRPAEDFTLYADQDEVTPSAHVTLFDLVVALETVLKERQSQPLTRIEREEISLVQRMNQIKELLYRKKELRFGELFVGQQYKTQVVVTFLALLELIKKQEVDCCQEKLFGEIRISLVRGVG